jgi:uncharacterized membrane protein (UPF0127 family)
VRSFLSPLVNQPNGPLTLWNVRTGAPLVTRLETAFDSKSRNRGLLGRTGVDPRHALVLAPCNSVHTFFMKFPIDVVFVGRDGTIRRIASALPPWRVALSPRSFAVIETAAGVIAASGTRSGDRLAIVDRV